MRRAKVTLILLEILAVLLVCIVLIPFFIIVVNSFKD